MSRSSAILASIGAIRRYRNFALLFRPFCLLSWLWGFAALSSPARGGVPGVSAGTPVQFVTGENSMPFHSFSSSVLRKPKRQSVSVGPRPLLRRFAVLGCLCVVTCVVTLTSPPLSDRFASYRSGIGERQPICVESAKTVRYPITRSLSISCRVAQGKEFATMRSSVRSRLAPPIL